MSDIQVLQRKFMFVNGDNQIQLDDINPMLPIETVKEMHSHSYPELLNASVVEKGVEDNYLVYEFQTIAGTKG